MFGRLAPAIVAYHVAFIMVAVHFGAVVLRGGSPVVPELYGAAVYEIPAMTWVTIQMLTHGLAALGGATHRPVLCLLGSLAAGALHAIFVALSLSAPHGTLLAAGSMWLGVGISSFTAILAFCAILRGRTWAKTNT